MLSILAGYFRYGYEFGNITTYVNGSYSLYYTALGILWLPLTMCVALLVTTYRHGEDSEYSIVL